MWWHIPFTPALKRQRHQISVSSKPPPKIKNQQITEKSRNDCATRETIHYFFENTYTETMCAGVPPQLCFNADETSVEVGDPRKVIIPAEEKEGRKINKFKTPSHISALITILLLWFHYRIYPKFLHHW